jgi:hypothetical protein
MTIRCAVLAVLALGLTGCVMTVRTLPGTPAAAVESVHGGNVRVTTRQGDTLQLANARVVGDSVVGIERAGSRGRISLPLADVESAAVVQVNAVRTLALVGAAALTTVVFFYVTLFTTRDN